ncbi:MAG: lysophospholipid acyltransferase family protein [Deltaproteobacteria bacterium]|nr:lysophospholipid acyltransferase family protein [Deltaproteobacteria bacterium]
MVKSFSKIAIRFGLLPIAYAVLRLYFSLIRIRTEGEEEVKAHLRAGNKAIAALWHQRILICLGYARRFAEFAPAVMISRSRDGEMIADVYRRLNFRPVRGSSSRGGREALAQMIADLADHPFAVHVVDGPQGPRGVVKAGLVSMAQLSGAPIVPVSISVNRAWVLNSWDRFLIPKPFSTVFVRWGEPHFVPQILDNEAFEAIRRSIEKKMQEIQSRDDRAMGWQESLL